MMPTPDSIDDGPTEYPCFRCGNWFAASELIEYRNDARYTTDDEGNPAVHENLLYCPECDREVQNELRDLLIEAGYDPEQNKERFD